MAEMSIRHCGNSRKTAIYWLVPNVEESKTYKYIVLQAANCPACRLFILEWHGIDSKGTKTPQKRISAKHHDEWIARTQTDIDDTMDTSRWQLQSVKCGVYRVKASLHQFPWNAIMATVR